jgi:hypothetical protein
MIVCVRERTGGGVMMLKAVVCACEREGCCCERLRREVMMPETRRVRVCVMCVIMHVCVKKLGFFRLRSQKRGAKFCDEKKDCE